MAKKRYYHVIAVNERTGRKTRMTAEPVTHSEGVTIMSKISKHPARRIQLEEIADNPGEIHVDINSHNFADNPRAIMDNLGKLSQRPHVTKRGAVTKRPSERLKARRAKNTRKGYFPNPPSEQESKDWKAIYESAYKRITTAKSDVAKQAFVSYCEGMLMSAMILGELPIGEYQKLRRRVADAAHIKV